MSTTITDFIMAKSKKPATNNNLDVLGLEMGNKPPQALDVEDAVLGAMLVEPNCILDAMAELSPACFYSEKNRMIFEAMQKLYNNHISIDTITVAQQLRTDGNLEVVGGAVVLAQLSQRIGAAAHIEFYINILKEKCTLRELITASYNILKDAYDESVDVNNLKDNAQTWVYDAIQKNSKKDPLLINEVITQTLQNIESLQDSHELPGVPSGFPSLDRITLGFQPSDLIILAARPSVGKTAFAMNIARNAAVEYKKPVAFFSLEMPAIQLVKRIMVSETGLRGDKIKGGVRLEPYEWEQLHIKIKDIAQAPIYIDDTPSIPIMEFRTKAKRIVQSHQVKLIIVDYLQLMQGPPELRGYREQEVAAISRTLKATAKELNVPIIALSQLSRNAVNRQGSNARPMLSDLRESGAIEQDADMVLFIHRQDYQNLGDPQENPGQTELIIAKHRNGEIGEVHLNFRNGEVKFVDEEDSLLNQAADDQYQQRYRPISELGYNSPFAENNDFDTNE